MVAARLFLALALGTVGFGFFLYGKKQKRGPQLAAGVLLMGFPYFVTSFAWMACAAVVVLGSMWGACRAGL